MKTLHSPESCRVLLEADGTPSAVRFRGRTWYVRTLLGTWTFWGDWWLDPQLEGESRAYFVLGTQRGEISVFHRTGPRAEEQGWFVEGWYD